VYGEWLYIERGGEGSMCSSSLVTCVMNDDCSMLSMENGGKVVRRKIKVKKEE